MLLGLCKDLKITIVLDLSISVLNLVKVCHKSVSLVIAICTLSCLVSNCFQAIHFWRPWTVAIDFLVICCLWPNKRMALNEIQTENDYWSDWSIAGSRQMVNCVPKIRWLKTRSQRLLHTVVPDGTFTVGLCKHNEMPHIIPAFPLHCPLCCILAFAVFHVRFLSYSLIYLFAACVLPVAEVSNTVLETWEWSDNKTANNINKVSYQLSCLTIMSETLSVFWTEGRGGQYCEVNKSGSVFISSCIQRQFIGTLRTQFCTFASIFCQSANHMGTCGHTSQQKIDCWLNFNTTTCNNMENKGKCQN